MSKPRVLRLLVIGAGTALVALSLAPASASSANISHAYHATGHITDGSIVSLDLQRSNYIQPANTTNGSRLVGVTVASNDSLLAVDASSDTVQVATSGIANTLVSTLDGDINVGDQIVISPFSGIGMKAEPGLQVIGLAQTAFNGQSTGATTQQVTNKNGQTTKVEVGFVQVSIAIGGTNTSAGVTGLNKLQQIVKSLTGHTIPTVRIVLSSIVALVALLGLSVLIYSSIYSSIISIGRNPLAKNPVFRTLAIVLIMTVLTAIVASLTIFLLLR
jgi:hypothetical protein